jgi:hypothetical protein
MSAFKSALEDIAGRNCSPASGDGAGQLNNPIHKGAP